MSDEHKTFKSKTIELFGSEFEVSHKANNIINNKFLVFLGVTRYYIKKVHNYIITAFSNCFNYLQSYSLFEPLLFLLLMYLVIAIILTIPTTFAEIDNQVANCFKGCELIDKYCKQYKNAKWDIAKVCVRQNISFFQVMLEEFKFISYWGLYILGCGLVLLLILAIIVNVVVLIFYGLEWIYTKIYKKVQEINEQIPNVDQV